MRRGVFSAVVLGLGLGLGSSNAMAAEPGAGPPAQDIDPEARKLHNAALAAFRRGEWQLAYEGFKAARTVQEVPQIVGNLGRAELELGWYREAATHLAWYLREEAGRGGEGHREVEDALARAQAHVGALWIEVQGGGADVWLDGSSIGRAPLGHEVYVTPGRHRVEARLGAATTAQWIEAKAGQRAPLSLVLTPPAAVSGESPRVATDAGGGGRHEALVWIGAGVTAVGVTAGVVLLGVSQHALDEAEVLDMSLGRGSGEPCPRLATGTDPVCEDIEHELAKATSLRDAGVAAFVTAGLVGTATLGYALFGGDSKERGRVELEPAIGATEAAIRLRGAW